MHNRHLLRPLVAAIIAVAVVIGAAPSAAGAVTLGDPPAVMAGTSADPAAHQVAAAARAALDAEAVLVAAEERRQVAVGDWWRWLLLGELAPGRPADLVAATIRRDGALAARDAALDGLALAAAGQAATRSGGPGDVDATADGLAAAWRDATDARRSVVLWALTQVGIPYVWAAAGPDGYDCSGFTLSAWATVGVTLPHWSFGQNAETADIAAGEARVGDLVLWDNGWNHRRGVRAGHVALVLGAGDLVVEAAGAAVRVHPLHTRGEIVTYGRVVAPDDPAWPPSATAPAVAA